MRQQCYAEVCYPSAMAADKKVASDLGVDYDELHLPLLMAAAYGGKERLPKIIVSIRNPTERLHCAYWTYAHYKGKYGRMDDGLAPRSPPPSHIPRLIVRRRDARGVSGVRQRAGAWARN